MDTVCSTSYRVRPSPKNKKRTKKLLSAFVLRSTLLISFLTGAFAATDCYAQRQGFSVLGAGFSVLDYEETSTLTVDGISIDIETSSVSIFTQSSGTFVSINPVWGFYLHTLSTLGVPKADERWELNDISVRRNSVSFDFQRLELLASRSISAGQWHTLAGVQYSNLEYRRFNVELTDDSAGFGITEDTFESGTISETVWDINAMLGIEFNTLFINAGVGWRYRGRALIGVPLRSTIVNTSVADGKSFSESFNGVQLRTAGSLGYQFTENVFVGASLELSITRKNAGNSQVDETAGVTRFPATTVVSLFPLISVHWSF